MLQFNVKILVSPLRETGLFCKKKKFFRKTAVLAANT